MCLIRSGRNVQQKVVLGCHRINALREFLIRDTIDQFLPGGWRSANASRMYDKMEKMI